MKILSIECSAVSSSAAVLNDNEVQASVFINASITHSETLLPAIQNMLTNSKITLDRIDAIAVSVGPGSFTGIRIGIGAVKGLALPFNIPCIPVSSLECMAYNFSDTDAIICAVMDARCKQVYNAMFDISNGKITRLCDDRAIKCEDLASELSEIKTNKQIIIAGDGTNVFMPFTENIDNIKASSPSTRYQNAIGVALAAKNSGESAQISADGLLPVYLRMPQAERELLQKKENKNENCNWL